MGIFGKLFGGNENQNIEPEKVFNNDGVKYPLTSDLNIFINTISSKRYGAIIINFRDYRDTKTLIAQKILQKFGQNSDMFTAITYPQLICSQCKTDLYYKATRASLFGAILDKCVHCGNLEAYYVFDCFSADSITQNDVDLIRKYHQLLGKELWVKHNTGDQVDCYGLECDGYGKVKKGTGYYIDSKIQCEKCYNYRLSNPLEKLKKNPNIFGTGLIRKARKKFAPKIDTQNHISSQSIPLENRVDLAKELGEDPEKWVNKGLTF